RKTSGSSCVRIGCQTGFSNPSTISSTTAATLGTHSSTNPGRLCPSRDATGQQSITQSEDWYNFRNGCLFGTSMLINGRLGRQLSLVLSGIAKGRGAGFLFVVTPSAKMMAG